MVVPNDAGSSAVVFVAAGPPVPDPAAAAAVVWVAATRSTVGLPAYRDIVPAICARDRRRLELVSDDILTPSRVDVEVQHRDTFRVHYVAGYARSASVGVPVGMGVTLQGPDLQNILRQSYDYLTIMPKLRSTYDRRLIYKTSYEGLKASLRYD